VRLVIAVSVGLWFLAALVAAAGAWTAFTHRQRRSSRRASASSSSLSPEIPRMKNEQELLSRVDSQW